MAEPLQLRVRRADPVLGAVATELRLELPSDVALVGPAVELISAHCGTGILSHRRVSFNLRTVLAEALTNAIVYGNRGDPAKLVRVRVERGVRVVHIHVEDDGDGFDAAAVPDPTTPDRLLCEDGRGLFVAATAAPAVARVEWRRKSRRVRPVGDTEGTALGIFMWVG